MLNRSILVKNSLEETEQILKELIPTINGKIKNISDEEYSIEWTYLYGLQTIFCETKLIPNKNGIEIFSIADSDDIYKTGVKKALENLYIALSQTNDLELLESETKSETNPKTFHKKIESNSKYWLMGIVAFVIFIMIIPTDFKDNIKNANNNQNSDEITKALYDTEQLLNELIAFKDKSDFHHYGFNDSYKYKPWLNEVNQLKNRSCARNILIEYGFALGDLEMLGLEYARSKGKETDYSVWAKKRIKHGISSVK